MYSINEINNNNIYPDLPDDTLVLVWYNEITKENELYLACEIRAAMCNIHLYIPKMYRTKERIDYAKVQFFPTAINYLREKFNIKTILVGCNPDDTKVIKLMQEVGFQLKDVTVGSILLKED